MAVKKAQEPWKGIGEPQSFSSHQFSVACKLGVRGDPTLATRVTPIEGVQIPYEITLVNLQINARGGDDQGTVVLAGTEDALHAVAVKTSCRNQVAGMVGVGKTVISASQHFSSVRAQYAVDTDIKSPDAICVEVTSEARLGRRGIGLVFWTKGAKSPVPIDLTDSHFNSVAILDRSYIDPLLYELSIPTATRLLEFMLEVTM